MSVPLNAALPPPPAAAEGKSQAAPSDARIDRLLGGAPAEPTKEQRRTNERREVKLASELKRQSSLLADDVEFLHQAFTTMDADGDGLLLKDEMRLWVTILNEGDQPTPLEMQDMLDKVGELDESKDEGQKLCVNFEGFLVIVQDYYMALGASHMRNVFSDIIGPEPTKEDEGPVTGASELAKAKAAKAAKAADAAKTGYESVNMPGQPAES